MIFLMFLFGFYCGSLFIFYQVGCHYESESEFWARKYNEYISNEEKEKKEEL